MKFDHRENSEDCGSEKEQCISDYEADFKRLVMNIILKHGLHAKPRMQ
jgi:hypothetical protein